MLLAQEDQYSFWPSFKVNALLKLFCSTKYVHIAAADNIPAHERLGGCYAAVVQLQQLR
jgi:hypothetical protein